MTTYRRGLLLVLFHEDPTAGSIYFTLNEHGERVADNPHLEPPTIPILAAALKQHAQQMKEIALRKKRK